MDGTIWAVLGVTPGASADDIKAAFRARARRAHPDHGGDAAGFRRLVAAQERALELAETEADDARNVRPIGSSPSVFGHRFVSASTTTPRIDLVDIARPTPQFSPGGTTRTFDQVLAAALAH